METKQTAVEWLAQILDIAPDNPLLTQAKAMEKEQIEKSYESGCIGEVFELNCNHSAEQYYNSTYGK